MDRIQKFLLKLDRKHRTVCAEILKNILILNLKHYDVQPLKGFDEIFRLRKGNIRIVFTKRNKEGRIINIGFRKDAYKF